MIVFTCKPCATEYITAKTHWFPSTSHQKIGRHHLNSFLGCECCFCPKAFQALLWTWAYYVICCNGLKMPLKTCEFLQREIIKHTMGFTTKEAFHFKLQGRCWFPQSYWLETAQLRSRRGAMNGDSRFSLPQFSSCELYCSGPWRGGRGPSLHMVLFHGIWETGPSPSYALLLIFVRCSFRRGDENNLVFTAHVSVCSNCHHC